MLVNFMQVSPRARNGGKSCGLYEAQANQTRNKTRECAYRSQHLFQKFPASKNRFAMASASPLRICLYGKRLTATMGQKERAPETIHRCSFIGELDSEIPSTRFSMFPRPFIRFFVALFAV